MYFYNKNSLYSTPTTSKSTSFFTTRNALPYDMVNIATTRLRQPQQQPSYGDATVLIPTPSKAPTIEQALEQLNLVSRDSVADTPHLPGTHQTLSTDNTYRISMTSSLQGTLTVIKNRYNFEIIDPTTLTPDRQPREEQPAKKPRQDDDDDL